MDYIILKIMHIVIRIGKTSLMVLSLIVKGVFIYVLEEKSSNDEYNTKYSKGFKLKTFYS